MSDVLSQTDTERVALLEQAFSAVEEVCSQLSTEDWDLPTDCPGWSVKDNLSHLASFEAVGVGRPSAPTDLDVSHLPHVANDFGAMNEREVEGRRALPGSAVLDEFREVTTARIEQLKGLDEDGWAATSRSPVGELPTRDFLSIRILDVFYHEQDIRRAAGKPGHLDGAVARYVFERMATRSLPRIVGKNAPDGAIVTFDVRAPGRTIVIKNESGKGTLLPEMVHAPLHMCMRMNLETFFCLLGGRWTPARARAEGDLQTEGDDALARNILDHIVVVP